jgi:hypothetical protein
VGWLASEVAGQWGGWPVGWLASGVHCSSWPVGCIAAAAGSACQGLQALWWPHGAHQDMTWYMLAACAAAGAGVYHDWPHEAHIISVAHVAEMRQAGWGEGGLHLGGATSLAEAIQLLRSPDVPAAAAQQLGALAQHLELVAGGWRWPAEVCSMRADLLGCAA